MGNLFSITERNGDGVLPHVGVCSLPANFCSAEGNVNNFPGMFCRMSKQEVN